MSSGNASSSNTSPVTKLVKVNTIPRAGRTVIVLSDQSQRQALADGHGLVEVISFDAELQLTPWKLDGIRVSGTVRAKIAQNCIASLERIESEVDESVELTLLPEDGDANSQPNIGGEIEIDPDGPDEPDRFSGGTIDVGAIAEEFFALGIDPYPRKEGVEIATELDNGAEDEAASPFAALAELKRDP